MQLLIRTHLRILLFFSMSYGSLSGLKCFMQNSFCLKASQYFYSLLEPFASVLISKEKVVGLV